MLTTMERSTIKRLKKRGITNRAIAELVGHDRDTVARVLGKETDCVASGRTRRSRVDALSQDIGRWLDAGLPVQRMLELSRTHAEHTYAGGKSAFYDRVRKIRADWQKQQEDVPIRFEGLPGEYLQVDWGEVRSLPFDNQPPATRYFYAARLKYSRFMHVLWQEDMNQETLLRCLCATFALLGGVPWVCVFDNPRTVTTGRDSDHQPIFHPGFFQFATEFGFTPQACSVGAANQKGAVENLVKFVKSNFLPARSFFDDADLKDQSELWLEQVNTRVCQATGRRPFDLFSVEQAALSSLPEQAEDYGLPLLLRADRESLVPLEGSRYSVPVACAGSPVTVRLHTTRVRIYKDNTLLADHPRRMGAPGRVIDPSHFEPVLEKKPRARVFLYRDALLSLGEPASSYIRELVRRRYARQSSEILTLYGLSQRYPASELTAAIFQAASQGAYGAEYLQALLEKPRQARASWTPLVVEDTPGQGEVDRPLWAYEAHVICVPGGL